MTPVPRPPPPTSSFQVRKDLKSPLHFAACMGQRDVVKLLLDNGAHPNAVDKDLWSPLHHAAREGHWNVVSDLVTAGADVNIRDEVRETSWVGGCGIA